jgi:hypothetical protein
LIVFAIVMVVYQQVENYILQPIIGKAARVSGREADQESAGCAVFKGALLQALHAGGGTRTPDTRIMIPLL